MTQPRPVEHPHAPELGWAKRMLGAYHITGVFWFKLPYHAFTHMPRWLTGVAVYLATPIFFVLLRRIGAAVAANLEPVLGPCGFWERQRRIWKTLLTFAWCHAERYEFLHDSSGFDVSIEGEQHIQEASRHGSGLIFVTAHVGHWETSSRLISANLQRPAHVVREEEIDPQAQAFMEEVVRRSGGEGYTTHFASDDPRLGLILASALKRGEVVALQGDRPRAGGRTMDATLFGRTLPLPVGTAALARAAGVAMVPIFSLREGRQRYRVWVREPIRVTAEGDRASALEQAVQKVAAEVEWAIRREPHQWFCFRHVWGAPTRTAAGAP